MGERTRGSCRYVVIKSFMDLNTHSPVNLRNVAFKACKLNFLLQITMNNKTFPSLAI